MKKLAFVIGDGFSISFRKHLGVLDRTPTSPLVPCGPEVKFKATDIDSFQTGPLWREELFPELWKAYEGVCRPSLTAQERSRLLFMAVREQALRHSENLNSSTEDGKIRFITSGVHFEARSYLWHLFVNHSRVIREAIGGIQEPRNFYNTWEWGPSLLRMFNSFEVTVISYNYDMVIEHALSALGRLVVQPIRRAERPSEPEHGSTVVLKPHGSINFTIQNDIFRSPGIPHGMFAIFTGVESLGTYAASDIDNLRPVLFDCVPPGHSLAALLNPEWAIHELAHETITEADIIVLCGLSAAPPDDEEIRELLSYARPDTDLFQVGLASDDSNHASLLLRQCPAGRSFKFLAVENDGPRMLADALDVHIPPPTDVPAPKIRYEGVATFGASTGFVTSLFEGESIGWQYLFLSMEMETQLEVVPLLQLSTWHGEVLTMQLAWAEGNRLRLGKSGRSSRVTASIMGVATHGNPMLEIWGQPVDRTAGLADGLCDASIRLPVAAAPCAGYLQLATADQSSPIAEFPVALMPGERSLSIYLGPWKAQFWFFRESRDSWRFQGVDLGLSDDLIGRVDSRGSGADADP